MRFSSFGLVSLLLFACGESASTKGPVAPQSSGGTAAPAAPAEEHVAKVEVPAAIQAVVDAADRDPADKALDAGRKPAEMLAFAGIKPGMRVAELGAGGGYTAELLARAVGPTGIVYGHNTQRLLEKFAEKPWTERLAKPANKNVVRVTREFDEPLPPEANNLDVVILNVFYHDTFWMKTDQAKLNANVLRSLKPHGVYLIIDHSGRPGTGTTEVQSLHRIEEAVVRKDLAAAHFTLAASADFLRNPADTRDWSASPGKAAERRGTSDRFVLKFVKP